MPVESTIPVGQLSPGQLFCLLLCLMGCVTLVLLAVVVTRSEASADAAGAKAPPPIGPDTDARHRGEIADAEIRGPEVGDA